MIFTIQVLENGTRSVSVGVGVSQKGAVQCRPQVLNSKFTIITQHQVLDAMTGNMVEAFGEARFAYCCRFRAWCSGVMRF